MLSLWSVKFIHLYLPKLCLTSYWQVSVLCLQHTGVYIRSGLFCFWFQERHCSWDQYGGSVDYVSCILLYSFRMVGLWMCCCKCMYFIGALCVVSSCWDSTSTSFLVKSSCSPPTVVGLTTFLGIRGKLHLHESSQVVLSLTFTDIAHRPCSFVQKHGPLVYTFLLILRGEIQMFLHLPLLLGMFGIIIYL